MSILEIGKRDTVHDVGVDGTSALVAVLDRIDETGDELLLVLVGEVGIGLAGRRIAGRMVVRDHERVCAPFESLLEHVTGKCR